jgi:transposase
MDCYVGLDVSQRQTAICIVDGKGKIVAEGKALTLPVDIHAWIATRITEVATVERVGLEAGAMSSWLFVELKKLGLPMLCLEAFQAHRFLKTHRNKTDKNDARGLAQMVRMGGEFIRPVIIRTQGSQEARMLLTLRQNLVKQRVGLENNITGSLKPFGILVRRGNISPIRFGERVLDALAEAEAAGQALREAVLPSLELHAELCRQLAKTTKQAEHMARNDPVCRRLMTAPGVGTIVALSFMTAVDTPERFSKTEDVGAYFGLTPKQYQSGETDVRKGISRLGNSMTRIHLVQAATVLLGTDKKWSSLRAWGMKIAKRRGFHKARIAVARKLAIVLHRMWINDQDFYWSKAPADKGLTGATPA